MLCRTQWLYRGQDTGDPHLYPIYRGQDTGDSQGREAVSVKEHKVGHGWY